MVDDFSWHLTPRLGIFQSECPNAYQITPDSPVSAYTHILSHVCAHTHTLPCKCACIFLFPSHKPVGVFLIHHRSLYKLSPLACFWRLCRCVLATTVESHVPWLVEGGESYQAMHRPDAMKNNHNCLGAALSSPQTVRINACWYVPLGCYIYLWYNNFAAAANGPSTCLDMLFPCLSLL